MSIEDKLSSPVQYERLHELCRDIFKYGEFDKLNGEFLELLMPIVNIVYYQSISKFDDGGVAREDLIQDTLFSLYKDMSLRWDKYIHIDNYYEYIKRIIYKLMINSVHAYHDYHLSYEYNPDVSYSGISGSSVERYVNSKIILESLEDNIYTLATELLSHRVCKFHKLMRSLLIARYNSKDESEVEHIMKMYSVRLYRGDCRFYLSRVDRIYILAKEYTLIHWGIESGVDMSTKDVDSIINRIRTGDYEMLSLLYGDTVIPEIYAEFGEDVLLRFIKLFGGTTITIPDSRSVGDTMLGSTVYTLADGSRDNLASVSDIYGLPYRTLQRIFDKYISDMKRRESYNDKNT